MTKTHGTRTTYNTGCRCDECRSANNAYMSKYNHEALATISWTAWRNKRPWEPWEDELALDYSKTSWQIADMLERTPSGVQNRRRFLKAHQTKQEARARTNS